MPTGEERPTLEYVQAAEDQMEEIWNPAWEKWKTYDSWVWGEADVWSGTSEAHKQRSQIHPGTAARLIDQPVDRLLTYEPKVHREPTGRGEKAKAAADRVELAVAAILKRMSVLDSVLTWRQGARHGFQYGYMVAEGVIPDPLEWAEKPTRPTRTSGESADDYEAREALYDNDLKNWFPFRVSTPHPSTILMDPCRKVPLWAIKRKVMFARDVEALTRKKKSTRKYAEVYDARDAPYEKVMISEHWSKYWHAVVGQPSESHHRNTDSQMLYVERNKWGYIPFAHAFSGLGSDVTGQYGIDTGTMAVGFLEHVLPSLKAQAQQFSAKQTAFIEAAYTKMRTTEDAAEAAQKLESDIIQGQEGDFGWLDRAPLSQWMLQVARETDQNIEHLTFALDLAGFRQEGVATVGQQAILSDAVVKKLKAVSEQLNHLASVMASNLLRLVDVMNEPICAGEFELKPEDINHNYRIDVAFEVIDPVLEMQLSQKYLQEFDRGLMDRETYWTATRQESPSTVKEGILEDMVWSHPAVIERNAAVTAKKMGVVQNEGEWSEMVNPEAAQQKAMQEQMLNQQAGAGGMGPEQMPPEQMPPEGMGPGQMPPGGMGPEQLAQPSPNGAPPAFGVAGAAPGGAGPTPQTTPNGPQSPRQPYIRQGLNDSTAKPPLRRR